MNLKFVCLCYLGLLSCILQLCIATLHLIGLAAKTDDDALAVLVKEKSDVIRLAIHDCISRAGEAEKSASAATAIDSATTASSQANESVSRHFLSYTGTVEMCFVCTLTCGAARGRVMLT